MTERLSDEESFWECVRIVCERVARSGTRWEGVTSKLRAKQVLAQLPEMRAATSKAERDFLVGELLSIQSRSDLIDSDAYRYAVEVDEIAREALRTLEQGRIRGVTSKGNRVGSE